MFHASHRWLALLLLLMPVSALAQSLGWDSVLWHADANAYPNTSHVETSILSMDSRADGSLCMLVVHATPFGPCADTVGMAIDSSNSRQVVSLDANGNCIWNVHFVQHGTGYLNSRIAAGPNGSVYIAGVIADSVSFPDTTLYGSGGGDTLDIFYAKLDANGNRLWSFKEGISGHREYVLDIGSDHLGNLYAIGFYTDSTQFSGIWLHDTIGSGFCAKYSTNGSLLWVQSAGDIVEGITILPDGSPVFIAGNQPLGGCPTTLAGSNIDQHLQRLNPADGSCNWSLGIDQYYVLKLTSGPDGTTYLALVTASDTMFDGCTAGPFQVPDDYLQLVAVDSSGSCQWMSDADFAGSLLEVTATTVAADGTIWFAGYFEEEWHFDGGSYVESDSNFQPIVMRYSPNGELLDTLMTAGDGEHIVYSMAPRSAGGVFVGSGLFGTPVVANHYLTVDAPTDESAMLSQIVQFDYVLTGRVTGDTAATCMPDSTDQPWPRMLVRAEPGGYGALTDESGNYRIPCDSGTYTVSLAPNPLALANLNTICPGSYTSQSVGTTASSSITGLDFAAVINEDAVLALDVAVSLKRPCWNSTAVISYTTGPLENTNPGTITVVLDSATIPLSSEPPWTTLNGNMLTYDLDTLPAFTHSTIRIQDSVDCAFLTELGSASCVSATYTQQIGANAANWDGSDLNIVGACSGPPYANRFVIQNVGDSAMSVPTNYRIYLDTLMTSYPLPALAAGDSLELYVPAYGQTVRLEADQTPDHPTQQFVASTLEACGTDGSMAPQYGFANQFSASEVALSEATWCSIFTGSYDPNDKQAQPLGITSNHYIDSVQEIDYQIRFQNTGNDTAFHVYILDTLSAALDLSTFMPGAASHDYTYDILGGTPTVVRFDFYNILLLDSNANEPESHGFVQFRIGQSAANPQGTLIENSAAIYFDFNPPIITNTTDHLVFDYVPAAPGDSLAIIIGDTLVLNPAPDVTICAGDTVAIGVNTQLPPATTSWTGTLIPGSDSLIPLVAPTVTTSYIFTATSFGRTASDTVVVIVDNGSLTITPDQSICEGDSVTISVSTSGAVFWDPSIYIADATQATQTFAPVATASYKVQANTSSSCQASDSVLVIVNPNPNVTASANDSTICAGATTLLQATGAAQYVWNNGTLLNDSALAAPTAQPTSNATFSVTGTNTAGCSNTASVSIDVTPGPPVTASSSATTICEGQTAPLAAAGALTYQWNNATLLSNATASNPVASPTTSTLFEVTGTDADGCTTTASTLITVEPLPVTTITNDFAVCENEPFTIVATGGATYLWAPAQLLTNVQNGTASGTALLATTTFSVFIHGSNGCTGSEQVTITANPLPTLTVTQAIASCLGETAQLSASGAQSYLWSGNATFSDPTSATPTVSATGVQQLQVVGTDANGCTAQAQVTMTVSAPPTLVVGPDTSVCEGDSIMLNANASGIPVAWLPANGISNLTATTPWASPTTTTTYVVSATSFNGCSATDSTAVTVLPAPSTSGISLAGNTLILQPAIAADWYLNGALVSTAAAPEYVPVQNGTYEALVTGANGCSTWSAAFEVVNVGIARHAATAVISLFPNPTTGQFTLAHSAQLAFTFEVYNSVGQRIAAGNSQSDRTVDLSSFSSGTYFVRIQDAAGATSLQPLVKE